MATWAIPVADVPTSRLITDSNELPIVLHVGRQLRINLSQALVHQHLCTNLLVTRH